MRSKEALLSGPLNTRQLALKVMAAKGLDTGDKVIAKAIAGRQKTKLLAMAQSWISLADLAERNSHLDRIDEPPPRRESHIH